MRILCQRLSDFSKSVNVFFIKTTVDERHIRVTMSTRLEQTHSPLFKQELQKVLYEFFQFLGEDVVCLKVSIQENQSTIVTGSYTYYNLVFLLKFMC